MDIDKISKLVALKSVVPPTLVENNRLNSLADFLEHPDVAAYLRYCLPKEVVSASNVRLLPLEAIEEEMSEHAAPGSFLRQYGYLMIATSIGGNAICFHSPSGKV